MSLKLLNKLKKKISTKNEKTSDYYLIHQNGSIPLVVYIEGHKLKVYQVLDEDTVGTISTIDTLRFKNYMFPGYEDLIVSSKEVFSILNCKRVFIGYDVHPDNTYVHPSHRHHHKKFGVGNSILVFDGKDYFSIYYGEISKLDISELKGTVIGYISPIGNNDFPNPMMFTQTHFYSWCNLEINEFKIPSYSKTRELIQNLCTIKNPFELSQKKLKKEKVLRFLYRYTCPQLSGQISTGVLNKEVLLQFG